MLSLSDAQLKEIEENNIRLFKTVLQKNDGLSIPLWFATLFCGMIFIIGYFVGRCM